MAVYQPTRPVFPPHKRTIGGLDLAEIQGDILTLGLVKKAEAFFFFHINDVPRFKSLLPDFADQVLNASQAINNRLRVYEHKRKGNKATIEMVGVNIAFSYKGFVQLGLNGTPKELGFKYFERGQKADAVNVLGDNLGEWHNTFLQLEDKDVIHGVIIVAGGEQGTEDHNPNGDDHVAFVKRKLEEIEAQFGDSIKGIDTIIGKARPGENHADEHFGFLDGISDPHIIGYDDEFPPSMLEPAAIEAGNLITGYKEDPVEGRRTWRNGSFLVFRYLSQRVPEFNKFLWEHPVEVPGETSHINEGSVKPEELPDDPADLPLGSILLGARLVGRWKSGVPIDLSPFKDELNFPPEKLNKFKHSGQIGVQRVCPLAAHVRKMNPRDGLGVKFDKNRMLRRGIQFGEEVTPEEYKSGKTADGTDRGLLFVCYQASIANSFVFVQQSWANNRNFPRVPVDPVPGLDPLIGQDTDNEGRKLTGVHADEPNVELNLEYDSDTGANRFVISKGGEYFFSPSITDLKVTIPNTTV